MSSQMTIRVIVADDHSVVRAGIVQFLQKAGGIEVVAEAEDGLQAMEAIKEHSPHVAVLDIQMPGMSGIEVTRALRSEGLRTGVLILTAYDDDPYVLAVLQAGANGYVLKTAEAAEIARAVRSVFEGQSALDPAIARKVMAHLSGRSQSTTHEALTSREIQVLRLVARGQTNRAIGVRLGISDRTVQGHLAKVFNKLQAASRTEAVMRAVSLGWLPANLGDAAEE